PPADHQIGVRIAQVPPDLQLAEPVVPLDLAQPVGEGLLEHGSGTLGHLQLAGHHVVAGHARPSGRMASRARSSCGRPARNSNTSCSSRSVMACAGMPALSASMLINGSTPSWPSWPPASVTPSVYISRVSPGARWTVVVANRAVRSMPTIMPPDSTV